jgi:chromate transporter
VSADKYETPAIVQTSDESTLNHRDSFLRILWVFLRLGLTSFGGPVAHLGYFRDEFVARRKWLSESTYADLVALCQFLPGPASSQVGFSIGWSRGGLKGGLAAWLGFTMPSAIVMIAFAYGVTTFSDALQGGWVRGLKIAAVAVVAQAVWGMATQLCLDRTRASLALAATLAVLAWPSAMTQVLVILAGALLGLLFYRAQSHPGIMGHLSVPTSSRSGLIYLALFFALLLGLPGVVRLFPVHTLEVFDGFYRAGSLVFGGGHVVLPLLQAEVVPPGWLTDDAFLAGYGAAQAVPGPLFTFAAYLGAVMGPWPNGWLGGAICLVAVFLPSILLVLGVLPFWEALRKKPAAQAALKGTNAVVVGILLAALYDPVWLKGIHNVSDFMIGLGTFGLLQLWKVPAWLVVILAAAAGVLLP